MFEHAPNPSAWACATIATTRESPLRLGLLEQAAMSLGGYPCAAP
jgi:hypothetical protein